MSLSPQRMGEETVIRFRVGRNIRKGVVKVFGDDKLLYSRKRPVMAPGEMEQVIFKREWLTGAGTGDPRGGGRRGGSDMAVTS